MVRREALPEPLVARLQAGELGDSEYTVLNLLDRFHSEPGVPMPARALSKFPKRTLAAGSGVGAGANCEICGQQYQVGQQQRTLPCGHDFHCRCIDPWLTTQRSVCPVDGMCVYVPDDTSDDNADEGGDAARSVRGVARRRAASRQNGTASNHEQMLPAIDLGSVQRSNRQRRGGQRQEQRQERQRQQRQRQRPSGRVLGTGMGGPVSGRRDTNPVSRDLVGLSVSGSGQSSAASPLESGAGLDAAHAPRLRTSAARGGTGLATARNTARGVARLSVMGVATSAQDAAQGAMNAPAAVMEAGSGPAAAAAPGRHPRAALMGQKLRREGGAADGGVARAAAAAAPRTRGPRQPPKLAHSAALPGAAPGELPQLAMITTAGRGRHAMNPVGGRSMGGATEVAVRRNRGTFAKAKAGRSAPPQRPGAARLQPLAVLGGVACAGHR